MCWAATDSGRNGFKSVLIVAYRYIGFRPTCQEPSRAGRGWMAVSFDFNCVGQARCQNGIQTSSERITSEATAAFAFGFSKGGQFFALSFFFTECARLQTRNHFD